MKWFGNLVVKVLIIAGILGFCWFAWDKIQTHDNTTLKQQVAQLEERLEKEQERTNNWKLKFKSLQELIPASVAEQAQELSDANSNGEPENE